MLDASVEFCYVQAGQDNSHLLCVHLADGTLAKVDASRELGLIHDRVCMYGHQHILPGLQST